MDDGPTGTRRVAARLLAGLAAVYVALFVWLCWRSIVLQPYADGLGWMARYYALQADGRWGAYFQPDNYHRLIWTLSLLWLDIRLFGAHGWSPPIASGLCLGATAAILAREAAAAARPAFRLAGAVGAVFLTLLASSALDVSQAINGTYIQGLVFAVAAVVLATPAQARTGVTSTRVAALVCLVAAGFGNAAALAVWPALLFTAWRSGARWSWRLLLLVVGAVTVVLYARGQTLDASKAASHDAHGLIQAALLGLDYLGLPWTRAVPALGALLGAALLALSLVALVRCGGRDAPRSQHVAVALILLSLGTAAMAALGRAGQVGPVPIRYAVFMTPAHVGLWLLALPWIARRHAQAPTRIDAVALGIAGAMLLHQVAGGLPVVRTGDTIRQTLAAFRAGVITPRASEIVYPDFAFARDLEARMRADGLYQDELHLPAPLAKSK